MTIVTPSYRPKRAPRKKRPQPPIANRIVTPAPLKPRKGPVIRMGQPVDVAHRVHNRSLPIGSARTMTDAQPKRSAIVEPKRKPKASIFGAVPDMTEEEYRRRGDAADALWRELVRMAAGAPAREKE